MTAESFCGTLKADMNEIARGCEKEENMEKELEKESRMGAGIAIGLAIGAAIGLALDNIAIGIPIGVAIGAGIGVWWDRQRKMNMDKQPGIARWLIGGLLVLSVLVTLLVLLLKYR